MKMTGIKKLISALVITAACIVVPVSGYAGELSESAAEEVNESVITDVNVNADANPAEEILDDKAFSVTAEASEDSLEKPLDERKLIDVDSVSADYLIHEEKGRYDVQMYLGKYTAEVTFRSTYGFEFGDGITTYDQLYTTNGKKAKLIKKLNTVGYEFKGWKLYSSDGKKVSALNPKHLEEDFILYADFKPYKYNVIFKKVKPAQDSKITKWKAPGLKAEYPNPVVTWKKDIEADGYVLVGWYDKNKAAGEFGSYENPYVAGENTRGPLAGTSKKDKKVVLYPKWEKIDG